jgi:hypothetical protein
MRFFDLLGFAGETLEVNIIAVIRIHNLCLNNALYQQVKQIKKSDDG